MGSCGPRVMKIVEEAEDIVSFQLFTPRFCRELARWSVGNVDWAPAWSGYFNGDVRVSRSFRACTEFPIERVPRLRAPWREACAREVFKIASSYWDWPITRCDEAQIVLYEPGGYFKMHFDYLPGSKNPPRLLSLLCYLNDDFSGGRTVFMRQNLVVEPRPGMALLFPSGLTHPHEVEPTAGGPRLVISSFFR